MPLNLLNRYNELLDIIGMSTHNRNLSLRGVFDRDITNNTNFKFRTKQITPTPLDGEIKMDTLFLHLTRVMVDKKTRAREYDVHRSQRLHWVKYHIEEKKKENMLVYSVKEPNNGNRTYIYDKDEMYVIVLEPLRKKDEYYLLSAYYVRGKDIKRNKFEKKYKRRLEELL